MHERRQQGDEENVGQNDAADADAGGDGDFLNDADLDQLTMRSTTS
jgi:hypothetical protein